MVSTAPAAMIASAIMSHGMPDALPVTNRSANAASSPTVSAAIRCGLAIGPPKSWT